MGMLNRLRHLPPWSPPWLPVWSPFGGMPGRADDEVGIRWLGQRAVTERWFPQGIDTGVWRGRPMLAVSWYRQNAEHRHLASRVTLIDLSRRAHLDIALTIPRAGGAIGPAPIHAGGLAWFGDRLFVAATAQGIWEYDLGGVVPVAGEARALLTGEAPNGGSWSRRWGGLAAPRVAVHPVPLRCSFIGRVFDADGRALPRVLIGEFRHSEEGRVGEFSVPEGSTGFVLRNEAVTGVPRMQGAAQWGARRFVSQSHGMRDPGTLWIGDVGADGRCSSGALRPSGYPLPPGCEDLALDPGRGVLWAHGEHPWHRVVRGIPLARLMPRV